jgi:hypothetical protein
VDLFHASEYLYSPGTVLPALNGRSHFQQAQHNLGHGWVENAFERARPPTCVSRIGGYFACATVVDCATFVMGESRFRTGATLPHYYRIAVTRFTRAPMAIVGSALNGKLPRQVHSLGIDTGSAVGLGR